MRVKKNIFRVFFSCVDIYQVAPSSRVSRDFGFGGTGLTHQHPSTINNEFCCLPGALVIGRYILSVSKSDCTFGFQLFWSHSMPIKMRHSSSFESILIRFKTGKIGVFPVALTFENDDAVEVL